MREIELTGTGQRRALPAAIFGLNAPVPYAIPHEDPRVVDVGRSIAPGHLRFPGGSVANFFDWRTGHVDVPEVEGESMYRTYMRRAAGRMRPHHPDGCRAEHFAHLAGAMGAELIWVANLETSSPDEQAAWAADMRSHGVLPHRIELGNEFYLALLNDPVSRARFPDWSTTLGLMRQYVDAMAPSLDGSHRIAVQAAASRWRADHDTGQGLHAQAWRWDDEMGPEEWFHAVTVHPYPEIDHVCGPGASASLPGSMATTLPALLARVDGGTARMLDHTADRMLGKEIWVTEWGAGEIASLLQGRAPVFNGMWLHVLARMGLALLRHPAVSVVSYHAFFFDGGIFAVARPVDGPAGYEPIGPATLLRWFTDAANGGAEREDVCAGGARSIDGGGLVPGESYRDVHASLFLRDGAATLLVQNSSAEPTRLRLKPLGHGAPATIECMAPALTASLGATLPPVDALPPEQSVDLPPWCTARVRW